MKNEVVPFFIPDITPQDKESVLEALNSRWLTGGPRAVEFEELFANYVGVKYAIAVNSCTAALHLVMRTLGVGPGDEVIVPVFTFAATANAPLFCGAKPVLADIDERTFNISPASISAKITPRTKAITVVHYGGQPGDMKEIMQIAEEHKLPVIEDCAHSLGASYRQRKTGSIGIAGCFSFYPTKNITTLEGGMITTNSKEMAEKVKILRNQGMNRGAWEREKGAEWHYDVVDFGHNYRLNEVQAALGISQLSRIDEMNQQRTKQAHHYTQKLGKLKGLILPSEAENRTRVYHLYAIRIIEKEFGMSRDELFDRLSERGVGLSVHYTPLHLFSFYQKKLNCQEGDYPIAERVYNEVLSLPLFTTMSQEQMDYVVRQIGELAISNKSG